MPKEKQPKKKGPTLRHAPLGVEVEKKQKVLVSSRRDEDDVDDTDLIEESNVPQQIGTQIFDQARKQRQEMSMIGSAGNNSKAQKDDSDYDVSMEHQFAVMTYLPYLLLILTRF